MILKKSHDGYCISQFVVDEMYSYICLRIFPVLWQNYVKNYTTTVGTIIYVFIVDITCTFENIYS